MNWLFLALLAPAIYAVVNYIDKYVVESKVKDYRGMPIYGAIVGLFFGTFFWIFSGFPLLSTRDALLVITTGILSLFGYYLYFNAISKSQTSFIIILFQMGPIFTLILSFLFLRELISFQQLLGFVLVLSSAIALSVENIGNKFKLSSSFYLILIADLLFSISAILIKFTINANSFSKILCYESWGIFLGGLILYTLFPPVRNAFSQSIRSVGKTVLGIMFFNEGVFIVSKVLTFLAISLGPVALVSVLGSTQVFYGILYGVLLTLLVPQIFKEDITRGGILKKVILSGVLFSGIYLIY